MILCAFLISILISFSSAALATDITLRSGEHEGFSRVVVGLPDQDTQWKLEKSTKGYKLKVDVPEPNFIFGAVFGKISRKHLMDLSVIDAPENPLLEFTCSCTVQSYKFAEKFLVIDIKSANVEQVEPFEFSLSAQPREGGRVFQFPSFDLAPPSAPSLSEQVKNHKSRVLNIGKFVEREGRFAITKKELIEQITQATTNGVLGRADLKLVGGEEMLPLLDFVPLDNVGVLLSSADESVKQIQIEATMAAGENARLEPMALLQGRSICTPDSALDLEKWSLDESFDLAIGKLRGRLVNELDTPDREAIEQLARTYLYFSFGAEARKLLAVLGNEAEVTLLTELSFLLEGTQPKNSNVLREQLSCPGRVSMWAMLANTEKKEIGLDYPDIPLTFSSLPAHLRLLLGPILSDRLLEVGQTELAAQILNASDRSGLTAAPSHQFSQAMVFSAKGEIAQAEKELDKLLKSESSATPLALMAKINIQEQQDTKPLQGIIDLSAAYATELRATPLEAAAEESYVQALLLSGQYEEVFSRLDSKMYTQNSSERQAAWSKAVISLSRDAETFVFLELTSKHKIVSKKLDFEGRYRLAKRYLDAGFAGAALAAIGQRPSGLVDEKTRMLLAEVALAMGRPHRAAAELLGISSARAEELRARINVVTGQYDNAHSILESLGETQRAETAAWLASDLEALRTSENPIFASAAQLPTSSAAAQLKEEKPSLHSSRLLLQESVSVRELLKTVLN